MFSAALPGDGSRRILASLENSGKTNTPVARLGRLRPIQLVTVLTLLAVVTAAIAAISYWGLAPAPYSQPFAPAVPQAPPVSTPDEVQRRAAAIVNEPLPAMAPARQKLAAAMQAKAAPPLREAPALAAIAAPAPTAAPPSAHPALHTERGTHTRQRHQPRHARAAGPARLAAAAQHTDSDVALLAALVAHTDGQPSAMVHTRDVVERRDGDSTDALLRRCGRLGGPEAGLCRARICDGQWLHEAACRTPLSD
ncbi:hypothetical protein ASC94_29275 [Massilia sp. Root418]|nr:hypothetical protein ASC94_29275 [Massilia sp. Root418]